jgi:hypothetical protein
MPIACRTRRRWQIATIPPWRRSSFRTGYLNAEHLGRKRRRQVVLDHGVQAGELLVVGVGVDGPASRRS